MLLEPPSKHQKKKVSKYLSENEKLIIVTGIGKQYFLISLFILLILPLVMTYTGIFIFFDFFTIPQFPWLKFMVIPGLIWLIYDTPKYSHLLRSRQSFTYVITDKRFMIVRGIFSRKILTAPLIRITHVTVEQSFFQRFLFNCGHLVIITAGYDQREIVIENIGDPVKIKIMIEELTEKLEGLDKSEHDDDYGSDEDDDDDDEDEYLKNRKKKNKDKEFKLRSLKN